MLNVRSALTSFLCFWFVANTTSQHFPTPGGSVMGEGGLRKAASNRAMPTFPPRSRAAGAQGVAVAYVTATPAGPMGQVDILEAPDAAIAESVREALMKWRIPSPSANAQGPRHFEGRVTFYFKILKGHGFVLNPEQMDGNQDVWDADYAKDNVPSSKTGSTKPSPSVAIAEIGPDEASRLASARDAAIIDVRERDEFARSHTPGATVMPVGEILVRSRAEINPSRPIVVDCSQGERTWCKVGAGLFVKRGFREVMTIIP